MSIDTFYYVKKTGANGNFMGFHGWHNGLLGPLSQNDAERVSAVVGGSIRQVSLENSEAIMQMLEREEKGKIDAADLMGKHATQSYHNMKEEMREDGIDVRELKKLSDVQAAYHLYENHPDILARKSYSPITPEEDYPGHRKAITIMARKDGFDHMDHIGEQSKDNVRRAWDEFIMWKNDNDIDQAPTEEDLEYPGYRESKKVLGNEEGFDWPKVTGTSAPKGEELEECWDIYRQWKLGTLDGELEDYYAKSE